MKIYKLSSNLPIFPIDLPHDSSAPYVMQVQAESVSDGYHTMDELYDHRRVLFSVLIRLTDNYNETTDLGAWKSKLHSDGTMFDEYFIVGINTTFGQISYHFALEHWNQFDCSELERAPEYDGHTSQDVIERLLKL